MANSLKRYVEVELDGKMKLVKFDFNAVSEVEEYFGKGIMAIFKEDQVGFNTIRILYHFGLKWKYRNVTPQVVGTWLQDRIENGADFAELMEPVMKALQLSGVMGKPSDSEDENDEINDDFEENEKN
jgi:hypothetical protein